MSANLRLQAGEVDGCAVLVARGELGRREARLLDGMLAKFSKEHTHSEDEVRFLTQIRRYSPNLNDSDRKLVLAMVKKMAATSGR